MTDQPKSVAPITPAASPAAPKEKGRLKFIDSIRGIAACLVMLQHCLEAGGMEVLSKDSFALSVLNFGESGVLAFFLVSGFVIPLSLEKWNNNRHFWLNRAFRIYPLYLLIYIITLAASGRFLLSNPKELVKNFGSHLLFIQEYVHQVNFVGGSWTLSLEAVWYVLFSGLFLLGLNRRAAAAAIPVIGISIVAVALSALHFGHLPLGRLSFLVACVLGLFCYRWDQEPADRARLRFWIGTVTLVILVNLTFGFAVNPSSAMFAPTYRCVLVSWAVGALIFTVPFIFRHLSFWQGRTLAFLGRISFSIYLLHPVMLIVVEKLHWTGFALMVSVFASTVTLSYFTYTLVEKPAMDYAHMLRVGRPAAAKQ